MERFEKTAPAILLAAALSGTPGVEIIARKGVEALGGAAKLRAARTERMTGRIRFGAGPEMPFSVELARPGKIRTEVTFPQGIFVQAFDGKTGWVIDSSRGGRPAVLPPERARNLPEQADMDGPLLRWKERGIRLAAEGREKVRGIEALRIRVTLANGVARFLDLDASSFRKLRWQGELGEGSAKRMNESFFSDYRKVGPLLFPFRIESGSGGEVTQVIVFDRIEVNPPIDDSRFAMP